MFKTYIILCVKHYPTIALAVSVFLFLATFLNRPGFLVPNFAVQAQASCMLGDANNDQRISLADFEVWRSIYLSNNNPLPTPTIVAATPTPTEDIPRASVIADGLNVPWSLAFLPNGDLLFTERPGRVRIIRNGQLQTEAVAQIAGVAAVGEGGLLGMAIHPQFASNGHVYFYFTTSVTAGNTTNRIIRMTYSNQQLSGTTVILDNIAGANIHNGGRIKFGPDGYLYIGTGDAADPSKAQDKNSLAGKILRVTDTGEAAPGNPFNNRTYSYGHRNPQGLAWDASGQLWQSEHGPDGQDELNKITAGQNYGWPTIRGDQTASGMISPVAHSGADTWAPSGMSIIGNQVYIASLRGTSITKLTLPGGTNLTQYFKDTYGRIRDVVVGPDGMLYISTSNTSNDRIIRVNPAKL